MSRYSSPANRNIASSTIPNIITSIGFQKQVEKSVIKVCQQELKKTNNPQQLQVNLTLAICRFMQKNVGVSVLPTQQLKDIKQFDAYGQTKQHGFLHLKTKSNEIRIWTEESHYNKHIKQWRNERVKQQDGNIIAEKTWDL